MTSAIVCKSTAIFHSNIWIAWVQMVKGMWNVQLSQMHTKTIDKKSKHGCEITHHIGEVIWIFGPRLLTTVNLQTGYVNSIVLAYLCYSWKKRRNTQHLWMKIGILYYRERERERERDFYNFRTRNGQQLPYYTMQKNSAQILHSPINSPTSILGRSFSNIALLAHFLLYNFITHYWLIYLFTSKNQ